MNIYKSKYKPVFIHILFTYAKRYGGWILFIWFVFFLMFRSQNIPIILLFIVLLSLFIGYGRSYPQNRIIYKVIIDHSNKRIYLSSYVLWKHKTIIPFEKLYFECFKKSNKKTETDEWLIAIGKRPWPVIGTIKSSGSSYWEYDKMKELAFELHQIKQKHILWKPTKSFFKKQLVPGYNQLMFDFEDE